MCQIVITGLLKLCIGCISSLKNILCFSGCHPVNKLFAVSNISWHYHRWMWVLFSQSNGDECFIKLFVHLRKNCLQWWHSSTILGHFLNIRPYSMCTGYEAFTWLQSFKYKLLVGSRIQLKHSTSMQMQCQGYHVDCVEEVFRINNITSCRCQIYQQNYMPQLADPVIGPILSPKYCTQVLNFSCR